MTVRILRRLRIMNEKSEKCQCSVLGDTIKDENSLCYGDEPVLSSSLLRSGVPCEPDGGFQLWMGTAEGLGRVGTHSTRMSGRGYNKEIQELALRLVYFLVIPPRAPKSTKRDSVYALCFIALCTLCVPFIPPSALNIWAYTHSRGGVSVQGHVPAWPEWLPSLWREKH